MLLVPEIETVVILVPRTGSGSLRKAVKAKYPKAIELYRHMEADGVPAGYDRWPKVGVVRHPIDRLWSLYKFLQTFGENYPPTAHAEKQRASVRDCSFAHWLIHNEVVFTNPHDTGDAIKFHPKYNVRHSLPENRKSQYIYLRPDLGTEIYLFSQRDELYRRLGVEGLYHENASARGYKSWADVIDRSSWFYCTKIFDWDFNALSKYAYEHSPLRGAA